MADDYGLPPVPRGLARDMTVYLQSVSTAVQRLAGTIRGSTGARAVRRSEAGIQGGGTKPPTDGSILSAMIRDGAVGTAKLTDASVTMAKLADKSVDAAKLAAGAVTAEKVAAGSITNEKLSAESVTLEKCVPWLVPVVVSGSAVHGQTVIVPGAWAVKPHVCLSRIDLAAVQLAEYGVVDLRLVGNDWCFDAAGSFDWVAIGRVTE